MADFLVRLTINVAGKPLVVLATLDGDNLAASLEGLQPEHVEQLELGYPLADDAPEGTEAHVHTVVAPAISQGDLWALQCLDHAAVLETPEQLAGAVRLALTRKQWCDACRVGKPPLPPELLGDGGSE